MTDASHTHRGQPGEGRKLVPIAILVAVCLIILGSILTTLLIQHTGLSTATGARGRSSSPIGVGHVVTVTPRPPSHVPPPPPSAPPAAHAFSLQQNAIYAAATPCPVPTLSPAVIGPSGTTNEATPSATNTPTPTITPTGTPAATPTATATPAPTATPVPIATIPACGTGQPYGPQCSKPLPGPTPTYDEERQALYNASMKNQMAFSLVESIAWQESGWQQNIEACDGGVGTMQLMPDTTTWLNQYYGTNYSAYDLVGNTNLGVSLLRYLYLYYMPFCNQGMPAGQTCTGDTIWPGATDGATLRDILISAYNEGAGTMSNYGIINWWYVNSVLNLRQQFLAGQQ